MLIVHARKGQQQLILTEHYHQRFYLSLAGGHRLYSSLRWIPLWCFQTVLTKPAQDPAASHVRVKHWNVSHICTLLAVSLPSLLRQCGATTTDLIRP